MNGFTLWFLLLVGGSVALHAWLVGRQVRSVTVNRTAMPRSLGTVGPLADHQRAADYAAAKARFGLGAAVVDAAVLLGWTIFGGIALLDRAWQAEAVPTVVAGTGLILSVLLIAALVHLPLGAWRRFVVDQRFGFNRTTPRLFLADSLKGALVLVTVAALPAAAGVWLAEIGGRVWWVGVAVLWVGLAAVRNWAQPVLVAPLFNRFSPLSDASLQQRLESLLRRCGVAIGAILVMDGSRRSAHGNAFFTGLGNTRRIVLLDTLLAALSPEEIEAVVAHEAGHLRHHHLAQHVAVMGLVGLVALALLDWLDGQPGFGAGVGLDGASPAAKLAWLLVLAPVLGFYLRPLPAAILRRFEFEADAYAAARTDPDSLRRALVTLYRCNAETLAPDHLYGAFFHSHPPPAARLARLPENQ